MFVLLDEVATAFDAVPLDAYEGLAPAEQVSACEQLARLEARVQAHRLAAAIGLLQMKRWGQQWLIVTCWMGLIVWIGYNLNMTFYADVRFANITFPVLGWWIYDIFYITPFLALPYLHTVNREIFSE